MELTLTKTRTYKLKPYGHFVFKWNKPKGRLKAHEILISELHIDYGSSMPMSKEQENALVKEMKKHKTDVLTDGEKFYTRTNDGLTEIWHEKLVLYKTNEGFKELVDDV